MPARRLFLVLGILTVLTIGAVADTRVAAAVLVSDALLLGLFAFDLRRARRTVLSARRFWPPLLVQGSPGPLRLEVSNPSRRQVEIQLREGLHPYLAPSPLRHRLRLPAGESKAWNHDLIPLHRGEVEVAPLTVRVLGPWKLAWSQRDLLPREGQRIFPQVRWQGRVGQLLALAQRHQLGTMPLTWHGAGSEPYALREYYPGDPLNRIHWKSTARHGRLISREDTWERGARLVILLDAGRAMTSLATSERESQTQRSKLDHALAAALALTRVAAARGDRVTLVAFSDRIDQVVRVAQGSRGIAQAYGALYDLKARLVEPAFDLAAEQALGAESRSATVVVFTSVVDLAAAELLRDSLLRLESRHRPLLINLEDPQIRDLAAEPPRRPEDAFAQVAALEIVLANRRLAGRLRRAGVRVVNTPADRLALETLEAYLALFRGRRTTSVRAERSGAAGAF
ncbi:MAG: DUF58 domain-containing protein [Acidobacteria bacterium]|nr:DUF58 domain-containing protein [Acidobacteriota bacterium]